MRKHRFPYLLSWILLVMVATAALFGSSLMPRSIDASQKITLEKRTVNDKTDYATPPFAPEERFWLGTDHRGIDVLSLLLNGMKYTLGFALAMTAARFAVGLPLGLIAGSRPMLLRGVSVLQLAISSVPALLILYPALSGFYSRLRIDMYLPPDDPKLWWFNTLLFLSVTLVGIPQIAHQFGERTRFFMEKPFISAARLLGASRLRLAFRHILPNLRRELLYAFLAEFVQVLFLMGQLAIFELYLGGGEKLDLEDGMPIVKTSRTGEWCAMLAYGSKYLQFFPWIFLSAALFFGVTILIVRFFLTQQQKQHTISQL